MDTDLGPFGLVSPQTWSPDSLYLAGEDGSIIHIFMIKDGLVSLTQDIETGGRSVESISWSPDGQWLVYTSSGQIRLISTDDWSQSLLYDISTTTPTISGWITIPPKEE
jgi:WD40 repeat protein